MDLQKKDFVSPGFTPVERYAEVSNCTWDPTRNKWHIQGQLILEYDEDNGEEYGFTLEDGPDGYDIVEELSGPIPDPERYWLKRWARDRKAEIVGEHDW